MSGIDNIEESSSEKKPLLKKELESLQNSLGKLVHSFLDVRQIELPDAQRLNIPTTVYKRIIMGKFDKVSLPNLLKCILLLDYDIDLTINPVNKKLIRQYDLEAQTVKFKKGKGRK
jgi:hypothetical protein